MIDIISEYSEAIATFTSVILAGVLGFVGFLINNRREKREHTLNIMLQLLDNPSLVEGYYISNELRAKLGEVGIADVAEDERIKINMLMGFYEYLSIGYFAGHIHKKTLHGQRATGMVNFYYAFERYIQETRDNYKYPQLYKCLERFAKKFKRKKFL